ncbi:MAG: hypothetical protein HY840_07465 [Bacteroidetes bacterium]|nr:hypothetical protein [Bacteroidota bacterium]
MILRSRNPIIKKIKIQTGEDMGGANKKSTVKRKQKREKLISVTPRTFKWMPH